LKIWARPEVEGGEVGGAVADGLDAEAGEAFADCGIGEGGFYFGLYPGEDVPGGLGGEGAAPMIPLAPGRFSTMTLRPHCDATCCATTRAMVSGAPVSNGTTK